MATSHTLLLPFAAFLLLLGLPLARSQPAAAAPTPAGPLNLTGILEKGGQYTSFIRLLLETRVDVQLNSQLNNSYNGLTVFAPTDNAFGSLKPGTLNSLSQQEQIELVLYHVLPRFFSLVTFQTVPNPIPTEASGDSGVFTLNVTTIAGNANQANVSTGVVETPINTPLHSDFPLAVFSVEKVLLPYELFGPKPPAGAPSPSKNPGSPPAQNASGSGGAAAPEGGNGNSGAAKLQLSFAAGATLLGFLAAGSLL